MKFILKAYSICELGQRNNQEDALFPAIGNIKDSDRLFILCDGMGGHEAGEVASNLVCETMGHSVLESCPDPEGVFADEDFDKALSSALSALDEQHSDGERKMGTTMTFLKFHQKGCTIAHIGDSRVYQIRSGSGAEDTEILFQTIDHSLVNDLIRLGEMTKEEAKDFGKKNVITRAMQPHMERRPKADIYHTSDIRPGDYFMMCSDGILEEMEEQHLKFIFSEKGGDDLNKVNMLKKVTCQNRDNHSAIIVHVIDVEGDTSENSPFFGIVEDEQMPENQNKNIISDHEKVKDSPSVPEQISMNRKVSSDSDHSLWEKGWLKPLFALICFVAVGLAAYSYFFSGNKEDEYKIESSEVLKEQSNAEKAHRPTLHEAKSTRDVKLKTEKKEENIVDDRSSQSAKPVKATPVQVAHPVKPVKTKPAQTVHPVKPVKATPVQVVQPVKATPAQTVQPVKPVKVIPVQTTQPAKPLKNDTLVQSTSSIQPVRGVSQKKESEHTKEIVGGKDVEESVHSQLKDSIVKSLVQPKEKEQVVLENTNIQKNIEKSDSIKKSK